MCREVKRKKHVDEDTTRIEQGFDKDLTRIGNKLRNNQEPNHLNPMSLESSNDERTMNERSSIQIQTHIQTEPIIKKKKIRPAFVKPTVEEIEAFCRQRNKGIKGQEFFDHYETRGWVVGKNQTPMKDWQAAVRTWEGNKNGLQASSSQRPAGRNFTKEREQEQRDKYERLRSRNNILPGNLHKDKSNGTGIAVWQNRLIQFPKWKLDSLGEYAGPMKLENISNWMNAAQRPTEPEPKKQLMDNSARACGTELWTGLKEIMRSETNDPRGDILKLLERLAIKYPQHAKYLTYRKE